MKTHHRTDSLPRRLGLALTALAAGVAGPAFLVLAIGVALRVFGVWG